VVVLLQFVLRVTFGMALAMAITPSRLVTSGYYRVHLWVLLGLNTLGTLAALTHPGHLSGDASSSVAQWVVGLSALTAGLSYVGAVVWLYEKKRLGTGCLWAVTASALTTAVLATNWHAPQFDAATVLTALDLTTSGMLLGVTMAAMFLGHWYLNTPTMQISPLQRLTALIGSAALLRMVVCAISTAMQFNLLMPSQQELLFLSLRWLAGLVGVLILAVMTWQTLKIPNTQSATGILYVAVIGVFIGELVSQLISANMTFPL